jgi:hypothetical protein
VGGEEELKGGKQRMARTAGEGGAESRIKSRLHEITAASRAKMVVQRWHKFSKSQNIVALNSVHLVDMLRH